MQEADRGSISAGDRNPGIDLGLWQLLDEPTFRLMIDFHKHQDLDRMGAIRALRQAQLDMLMSEDLTNRDPHMWAAFVLIGGSAEF